MKTTYTQSFAPVVPLNIAQRLKDHGVLGNYHLLLAHDVVAHPAMYEAIYKDPSNLIIMDNSVIELGSAVDPKMIIEACDIVDATVLAIPDVLMDRTETLKIVAKTLDTWDLPEHLELMVIPQGKDFREWTECFNDLNVLNNALDGIITWIGVAKNINEKMNTSRKDALDVIAGYNNSNDPYKANNSYKAHLLGFSDDILDDMLSTLSHPEFVLGIDSAAPIWMGLRGISTVSSIDVYKEISRDNFWDSPYEKGDNFGKVLENIYVIRKFLKG